MNTGFTLVAVDVVVGQSSLGNGTIVMSGAIPTGPGAGPSRLEIGDVLRVADAGIGHVTVADGALLTAAGAVIAASDGGVGTTIVDDATIEVVTAVLVRSSIEVDGEILSRGVGRLEIRNGGGVIAPDGVTVTVQIP